MRNPIRRGSQVIAAAITLASSAHATLTIDLRARSTSSGVVLDTKNVYFTGAPGGTVSFDVYALITGSNGDPNDDGLLSLTASFLSTNGDLLGNLAALVDPGFTKSGSNNGKQQDLDSDGDMDVGSNNDASSANFFSARTIAEVSPTFGAEIRFGTLTWTFVGGSADAIVSFRKRNASTSGSWFEDGTQITSNNWFNGTPVTIYTPEPGAMLAGVVGLGLLARRRE